MSHLDSEKWQRYAGKLPQDRLGVYQRAGRRSDYSYVGEVRAETGLSESDARDLLRWLARQDDVPNGPSSALTETYLRVRAELDDDFESFLGAAWRGDLGRWMAGRGFGDDHAHKLAARCFLEAMGARGVPSRCKRSRWQPVWEEWDAELAPEPTMGRVEVEEPDPPKSTSAADVVELVQARVEASRRKKASRSVHEREVVLPAEPVGFLVMGDPHLDNPGCDWESLKRHVDLAKSTPGVMAATVGDVHDNWIGRLGRLYHKATVTAQQGWDLSEWLFDELDWFAVVGGNHDAWAHGPGIDPMRWLTDKCGVRLYAPDELRITVRWRDSTAEPFVWLLRHDVRGRSWFHATHGPHKEAMLDGRVHLVTVGHTHEWAYLTTEHRHGRVTHAARVRGYKRDDCYAREKGFTEQEHGEACLVVVDPTRPEPGRVRVWWDIEAGCDWIRARRARVTAA